MRYGAFAEAERLEGVLGDPGDPASVFSTAACADLDDADGFPTDVCAVLDGFDLARLYVPAEFGGGLVDYQDAVQTMRMVSRRDVTVAVAHGKTYLGAVSAWVGASREQAEKVGALVRSGLPISWALTEQAHGSDLLAGGVTATRTGSGYRLDGEKWLINNATRGGAVCVLARTDEAGGPRGFSVFMVEKAKLDPASHSPVPKQRTHGIRGADISGISFSGATIGADDLIGREGIGLESVLKGLQLTRTLCCALSLGAGDHALGIATRFAAGRRLYGRGLSELPAARHRLATAFADHLLAEAVSVVGSRSIQALTGEMSVVAAVVKYLVPTRTEGMIASLRKLVGARSLLRDVLEDGAFGKVERDHRIVSLFDGNTLVNLNGLVNLFPILLRTADNATAPDTDGIRAAATVGEPLAPMQHKRLSLLPRKGSSFLLALPAAVAEVEALAADDNALAPLTTAARALRTALDGVYAAMRELPAVPVNVPTTSFVVAQRLAACLGGAALLQLWLRTRVDALAETGPSTPLWRDGVWPTLALDRLLASVGTPTPAPQAHYDTAYDVLTAQVGSGRLTSLFDHRLAEATR
ncbi:acyl-CoA dehydrogenase [Actinokineospora spheciospongiae]|uniref:acyl-CoA dehydrogenase n=1 Tax=Actinokineospora spheciospongiae TaxID=909613 RepID=UPI000D71AD23|nr:acyl-CoA dehydrogenase [Actinokineospora spheciospongiae]PWW53044.1 alkylation response protein AidB-like acyl-CoA dehydrogenase [Actinokineospora spheciospongiae]